MALTATVPIPSALSNLQFEKAYQMHGKHSPINGSLSTNLTSTDTVKKWEVAQLWRVFQSPYFDPIEQAHAAFLIRSGLYSNFEVVGLTLTRLKRELNAGVRQRMWGVTPNAK